MKQRFVHSLRRLAAALHRLAGILNEGAYRLDHGIESVVIHPSPLRVLQAEIRQRIRDRQFDANQRSQGAIAVGCSEVNRQGAENFADQVDGHPLADLSSVNAHDLYLRWLKFIEHRPGWARTHANAVRRLTATEKAIMQEMAE
jgi:hypothetical protein